MNTEQLNLIESCINQLADEMFQELREYISSRQGEIVHKTSDYMLKQVFQEVGSMAIYPEDCSLEVLRYDISLITPIPMHISFGSGHLYIGPRLVIVHSKEEIVDWFVYLINKILPTAIAKWSERRRNLEKELLKIKRLEALKAMYNEVITYDNGNQYQH